ncbi:MAG: uncharacterized protein KVP18_000975 [Porospora cf. gigantea A]|uniref:uncharacterized protein n=1 Tax=Porospora cf. gigantea A TaxID=2853593 RepID=UPI003559CC28|nr:MAG: hypothetical protein KVP18_000975 [Porospora cf. gigantea A]
MCGIGWLGPLPSELPFSVPDSDVTWDTLLECLSRRGPDHQQEVTGQRITHYSSVLHIRGRAEQPLVDENVVLCYNGELYGWEPSGEFIPLPATVSDTSFVYSRLQEVHRAEPSPEELAAGVRDFLESLRGEFAVVASFPKLGLTFVARDQWGRRSLVLSVVEGQLAVVSAGPGHRHALELPCDGLYCIRDAGITRLEWKRPATFWMRSHGRAHHLEILHLLTEAVTCRLAQKTAVMFSGGIDSALLAVIASRASREVVLLNVSFAAGNILAPDRISALLCYEEMRSLLGDLCPPLLLVDAIEVDCLPHRDALLNCSLVTSNTDMDSNIACALHYGCGSGDGVTVRRLQPDVYDTDAWRDLKSSVMNAPDYVVSLRPLKSSKVTTPTRCVVDHCGLMANSPCGLCRLCCKALKFVVQSGSTQVPPLNRLVPPSMRANAVVLVNELRLPCVTSCSTHKWNHLPNRKHGGVVASLALPTEAWAEDTPRVVLLGTGADELFGGYCRHTTALMHGGVEGQRLEQTKDLQRLWLRNLGRDDRAVGFAGRESRLPYLDEGLLRYVLTRDFASLFPHSLLDKYNTQSRAKDWTKPLLRNALVSLGLPVTACFKKRAIQFGTRIAKVTSF